MDGSTAGSASAITSTDPPSSINKWALLLKYVHGGSKKAGKQCNPEPAVADPGLPGVITYMPEPALR